MTGECRRGGTHGGALCFGLVPRTPRQAGGVSAGGGKTGEGRWIPGLEQERGGGGGGQMAVCAVLCCAVLCCAVLCHDKGGIKSLDIQLGTRLMVMCGPMVVRTL